MRAAARAARGGLAGRRLQSVIIAVVALATATAATLAAGLLAGARAPFDQAFAAQHGATLTVTVRASSATAAELAATRRLPGVTALAGPFPELAVSAQASMPGQPGSLRVPVTLTGRASPGGPVDDLTLQAGRWARGDREVVWARGRGGPVFFPGTRVTLDGLPGEPVLTVVGVANSVTGTAQAWVLPGEIAALGGAPAARALYRFASAGSAAAVAADAARVRAALPRGALLGAPVSWLAARQVADAQTAPWVPFIVAFAVIALAMSVLIVVSVTGGAVAAGTWRIGVLKSIGFTPAQVTGAYALQMAVPSAIGCLAGVACGNLLSVPLLQQAVQVYGTGRAGVPGWVDAAVPLGLLGLACVAALVPALRAGRLSAVAAIAAGRAPRTARGYAAHRMLSKLTWLPRPVTLGLASPFTRPARTLVTLAAVLFGAIAVTFGAGLSTSLHRAEADISLARSEPVFVALGGNGPPSAAQVRAAAVALRAQPGTLHQVTETNAPLSVPSLASPLAVTAFGGSSGWTGFALITGHWMAGPGQADVNTDFLTATGLRVGDRYVLSSGGRQVTVRIAGEVFAPGSRPRLLTSAAALGAVDPGAVPQQYDVGLKPGTSVPAYASALSAALGSSGQVMISQSGSPLFGAVLVLAGALTVLLMAVAGLGVLSTVTAQVRERVHDLGVLKALGMAPGQALAMITCSVAATGLAAGVVAVPAGVALHRLVLPVMGHAAQSNLPAALLQAYRPAELLLLGLAGLTIAAAGALGPAGWAARARTVTALRTE